MSESSKKPNQFFLLLGSSFFPKETFMSKIKDQVKKDFTSFSTVKFYGDNFTFSLFQKELEELSLFDPYKIIYLYDFDQFKSKELLSLTKWLTNSKELSFPYISLFFISSLSYHSLKKLFSPPFIVKDESDADDNLWHLFKGVINNNQQEVLSSLQILFDQGVNEQFILQVLHQNTKDFLSFMEITNAQKSYPFNNPLFLPPLKITFFKSHSSLSYKLLTRLLLNLSLLESRLRDSKLDINYILFSFYLNHKEIEKDIF